MESRTTLAIDFGTSNSLVGAWRKGKRIEALPLDPGAPDPTLMRTLLYFADANACYYGAAAIEKYLSDEMQGRLFRSFKQHLANPHYLGTFVGERALTLESMVGIFLLEMKKRAEHQLDEPIEAAVIGRPARYSMDSVADSFALHRMTKAVEFAGFRDFEFMPEPLAAALDLRRGLSRERLVVVGDFGGGTSDFTVIRMGPYDFKTEHVLGMDGCPLAGDALDGLFMSHRLNEHFGAKARYRVPLGRNLMTMPVAVMDRLNKPAHIVHLKEPVTYEFIRQARQGARSPEDRAALDRLSLLIEDQQIFPFFESIESTKRALTEQDEAWFDFDYPGLELRESIRRSEFEGWAGEVREKIFASLNECLRQANVVAEDVDLVCLTGGSAKVPLIREQLVRVFGSTKLQTQSHFHSVLSGLIEGASLRT